MKHSTIKFKNEEREHELDRLNRQMRTSAMTMVLALIILVITITPILQSISEPLRVAGGFCLIVLALCCIGIIWHVPDTNTGKRYDWSNYVLYRPQRRIK